MKHNLTVISNQWSKSIYSLICAEVQKVHGQTQYQVTLSDMGLGQNSSALPQSRMTLNPNLFHSMALKAGV